MYSKVCKISNAEHENEVCLLLGRIFFSLWLQIYQKLD